MYIYQTFKLCLPLLLRFFPTTEMVSLSRCSFSVLLTFFAQMKVWEKNMAPIRTPEDSPRLFDMVRVKDASVRPAFYFALRDTLVAQDMEQATRMAFQKDRRWRVVTLKGQIIEMAGGWPTFCLNFTWLIFFL